MEESRHVKKKKNENNLLNYNAKSQQLSLSHRPATIQQFPLLMSSVEHKAHFHAWFRMFHINYRQSQRIVHGGAQCDLIRHNHTVITDASCSITQVISCTSGGLLIIEGTYVDCPVCVSCKWNLRWPPTAHTWWDLDFDTTLPDMDGMHYPFSTSNIHSVQNIRHNSYVSKLSELSCYLHRHYLKSHATLKVRDLEQQ